MADIPPIDWQEIIRSAASGGGAILTWFLGKFIYNRWERRRMEVENEIKVEQIDREASETASVFAKVASDTGQANINLRKSVTELLGRVLELETKVHDISIQTEDLKLERDRLVEKNRKLENRVKVLEDILRANSIAIPINGG